MELPHLSSAEGPLKNRVCTLHTCLITLAMLLSRLVMISPRVRSGKLPDLCVLHTLMYTTGDGKPYCTLSCTLQGMAICTAHCHVHCRGWQAVLHTIIHAAGMAICTAHSHVHCNGWQYVLHTVMYTAGDGKLYCTLACTLQGMAICSAHCHVHCRGGQAVLHTIRQNAGCTPH